MKRARRPALGLLLLLTPLLAGIGSAAAGSGSGALARTPIGGPAALTTQGVCRIILQNLDELAPTPLRAAFRAHGAPQEFRWEQVLDPWASLSLPPGPPDAARSAAFAVSLAGEGPAGAQLRCDWPASGALVAQGASSAGADLLLPLAYRRADGRTSRVAVQNTDPGAPVEVEAWFVPTGAAQALVRTRIDLAAGAATLVDLESDPRFAALPAGSVGSLRLRAARPLAAAAWVDFPERPRAAWATSAMPLGEASDTLFVPLIRSRHRPGGPEPGGPLLDTRIAVLNPGARAVEVRITYHGAGGACTGQTIGHAGGRAETLPPGGMRIFEQKTDLAPGGIRESGLPPDCYGSAVLRAEGGPILATVEDLELEAGGAIALAGAFNAVGPAGTARRALLPELGRRLIRPGGGPETSAIQVMNAGDRTTTMRLVLYEEDGAPLRGCGAPCRARVAPGASQTWWLGALAAVPEGFHGTALVGADEPIATLACHYPIGRQTDMACLPGLPMPSDPALDPRFHFPLALIAPWSP